MGEQNVKTYFVAFDEHIFYVVVHEDFADDVPHVTRMLESLVVDERSFDAPVRGSIELSLVNNYFGSIEKVYSENGETYVAVAVKDFFNTKWSGYTGFSLGGYHWGNATTSKIFKVADKVRVWSTHQCGDEDERPEIVPYDAHGVPKVCVRAWKRIPGGSYWLVGSRSEMVTDLVDQYVP